MPNGLTTIERRILQLLCTTLTESGRPPSVQELKDAAGVPSVSSLHGYLDRLQRKGLIRRDPTRPRAIEIDCQEFELARTPRAEPATALVRLRPEVFWAVAPGVRRTYDVTIGDGVPVLAPREELPTGPREELGCPVCGSDDGVQGSGQSVEGRIQLSCADCGHQWSRVPRQPCPRCGSGDVAVSGYQGWAYEDPEQARDDSAAPFYYVDWAVYRCRRCNNVWQRGRRQDRPPTQGVPTT